MKAKPFRSHSPEHVNKQRLSQLRRGKVKPYYDVKKFAGLVGAQNPELYAKLVDEEYKEFLGAPDDANKLQEAVDLIWVALGYCITRGWDVPGAWEELTRANMDKIQLDENGQLKRRADGKILKPENWQKPDFTPFVNGGQ
jgi:Phosphoribosyl-ATP pyrophosphohydrolase